MDILIICLQTLAVILSFFFIVFVVHQNKSSLCNYLLLYSIAVLLAGLAYLYEINSGTVEEALMAVRFEYLGVSIATVTAFLFTCELFRVRVRLWLRVLHILAFVATNISATTNSMHHLHYKTCSLEVREHFSAFQLEPGISYVLHTIIMFVTMAVCVGVIIMAWLRDARRREDYRKYLYLGIAALIPLLCGILRFVKGINDYDLMPFGLFCTNACFILIIYFFKIFDVAENAKNEVLETMEEGILVCDEEGKIAYSNAKMKEIIQNRSLTNVSAVFDLLTSTEDGEFCINGRYYSVTESEVYEGDRVKGKTLSFFDMTQTKEKERQLKELHQEAMAANSAKSSFLANMSHEIRTPINTILGMDELILREADDAGILEYARNIRNEGKTLISLIGDLLDFSKIESGKMELAEEEYSTASLMHDIFVVFSFKAEDKGLEFRVNVADDLPSMLSGDEIRIKQILSNLLSNAVKYTERGYVEINVEWKQTEKHAAQIIFTVRDSGIGIRKEDLDGIFEKYKRIDSKRNNHIEGTGLGMSITVQLLELMHGEIEVESDYGIGSEFKVRIPQKIVDSKPIGNFEFLPERTEAEVVRKSVTAPEAKILVVDDNVMNRVVARGLLKRTLVQVEEAGNGAECLQKARQTQYDIIFMDHMMPGMDGVETLKRLRRQQGCNENTVVIVLTANAVTGSRDYYIAKGFDDYLSKPISGAKLEEMLRRYLPEEKLLQPLEGFSYESGLKNFDGNEQVYRETLLLFASIWDERKEMLRQFLDEKNMADYAILIHAIKGDARTLGAELLGNMAYEQEMQSKAGDVLAVERGFESVIQMGNKVVEFFQNEFSGRE
ncbi:MAG: ATP-binding protein [Lachnospiraceae bacterium]|nr:ATP-binding protein [Lachnospiraceae bacterium]